MEIINEEKDENFNYIHARVKDANKLLNSLDFYHLTNNFGNPIWLKDGEEKSLIFKVSENQSLEKLIDFYFNGSYYIEKE